MKVIALATCHNRKDLTMRSLGSLYKQKLPAGCDLAICLVDDGSTDDTREAIRSAFPDVKLIEGSGSLFWAGGMRYGWKRYVKRQEFDYLLVFNDDVELYPDALETMLSAAAALKSLDNNAFAIAGAFKNSDSGELTYGGVVREYWWHPLRFKKIPPTDSIQELDTVNMNLTLISRAALDLVGFLSPEFLHKSADYDFGLRLAKAGGRIVLAPGYVGSCNTNPAAGSVNEPGISVAERWRRLNGVKGQPARIRAVYCRRHGGILWPLYWAIPYLRICFGSTLKRKKPPERAGKAS
jgi:GT2 family glycosyltransferase